MKSVLFWFSIVILFTSNFKSYAQPNCYVYDESDPCREACFVAEKGVDAFVGSVDFQKHLLKAIEICPNFSYAIFQLSVPYAKMGMMHEWIKIIDRAVEVDPQQHLGWRGWYHWFFMHNYEKAIADIERLESISSYDIGTTGDGLYHLNVLKGLCYKGLGRNEEAIDIIEKTMLIEEYYRGSYDLLHLGVLYLEEGEFHKSLDLFEQQNEYNEISEAYYYSAISKYRLGNKSAALQLLEVALEKYDNYKAMSDPYRQLNDEIFRSDILQMRDKMENNSFD